MARRSFPSLRFPFSIFDLGEDESEWMQEFSDLSGLSVSEDENHVYVEAALPGIRAEEIEMTYDKGVLWIKADKKEEEGKPTKKYYRKATSAFSYRIAVPGNVDEHKHPEAIFKDGLIKVTFSKTKLTQPRKIPVKSG